MKILHISRTMGQGGAEKVVYQLCKDNKDIEMIVASTGGIYEEELKNNKVKHYIIPDIDKKNPFLILKTLIILNNIVKKEKINIIHSHHRMAAFYSKIISLYNKKIKRVYTAHNVFYNKKQLLKFALKGSEIIAVGDGVKANLKNYFGIKDNIETIYNSVEKKEKISKPTDIIFKNKEEKIYIGTIGRITEQKGMDIFIKALAELITKNKAIHGFIIGDGEDKEKLQNLVKDLNIEKNIIFLGYRKDVFDIANEMDFLVLSSRWEGFPLTPIEVFSIGKTIIATNIDGNNEIVNDKHNGLLFEKDNVTELKEKINYLIKEKKKRKELEKNALNTFESKFSYSIFIKKYHNLYKKL